MGRAVIEIGPAPITSPAKAGDQYRADGGWTPAFAGEAFLVGIDLFAGARA